MDRLYRSLDRYMQLNIRKAYTIYPRLRKDQRFQGIGDYPLIYAITQSLIKEKFSPTREDLHKTLKMAVDKEFIRRDNSDFITQLLTP